MSLVMTYVCLLRKSKSKLARDFNFGIAAKRKRQKRIKTTSEQMLSCTNYYAVTVRRNKLNKQKDEKISILYE